MKENPVIFMVEDEQSVLSVNRRLLARRGYTVEQATCFADADTYLEKNTPDLLILDIMLPDGDGYEICRKFRRKSDNPVVFLSGKDGVRDKVEGLNQGGDYYLTKPYQAEEMLAVVKRLLERTQQPDNSEIQGTILKIGHLELDMQKSLVTLDGIPVQLTGKEYSLLLILLQNEGHEFSCSELYERVWNAKSLRNTATVRKHIMNLRSKIKAGENDDYDILTAYGKGYIFKKGL